MYKFEKLDAFLSNLGYPIIEFKSGFQLIKGINFEEAYNAGSIAFESDGIYLEYQGKRYKGYMFIDLYYVSYNGAEEKFPKFHLRKCETIQKFIDAGRFEQRYIWSNSSINDVTDRQSMTLYNDLELELCSYCRRLMRDDIQTTEDFYNTLTADDLDTNEISVDIFGYVKDKEKISKAYRTKMNYTCEECNTACKNINDRRLWHTHHIDGDKTNNHVSNLQCLCVECHVNVDQRHNDNFNKDSWINIINTFRSKYR